MVLLGTRCRFGSSNGIANYWVSFDTSWPALWFLICSSTHSDGILDTLGSIFLDCMMFSSKRMSSDRH